MRSEDPYRSVLDAALRGLARREHTRAELTRKLRQKGHDRALIERALDEATAQNLLSEPRFVESYVRGRLQRGYGPVRIRQELAQRGVGEDDLEGVLTESAEFWTDVARRALEKKFRELPASRDAWHAQARFLARRGFPADLIYQALGNREPEAIARDA